MHKNRKTNSQIDIFTFSNLFKMVSYSVSRTISGLFHDFYQCIWSSRSGITWLQPFKNNVYNVKEPEIHQAKQKRSQSSLFQLFNHQSLTNRKIIHINKKTEFIICNHHESIKASIPFHLVNGFLLNTWGKPSLNWNKKFLFNGSLNSPLLAFLHNNYGCQSCPAQGQLRFLDVKFYSFTN